MGRLLIDSSAQQGVNEILTASILGETVVADWVYFAENKPVLIVGVNDVVLTKQSFTLLWLWFIGKMKVYSAQASYQADMIADLEKLNSHIFSEGSREHRILAENNYERREKKIIDITFNKIQRSFKDLEPQNAREILESVLNIYREGPNTKG